MTRPLCRYKKADRTRTYQLRMRDDDSAELWVIAAGGRQPTKSRKLMTLVNPDEIVPVLESLQHELRVGGWSEV
jgi:hypothetical protein